MQIKEQLAESSNQILPQLNLHYPQLNSPLLCYVCPMAYSYFNDATCMSVLQLLCNCIRLLGLENMRKLVNREEVITRDRTGGNGMKLIQGMFPLDMRKTSSPRGCLDTGRDFPGQWWREQPERVPEVFGQCSHISEFYTGFLAHTLAEHTVCKSCSVKTFLLKAEFLKENTSITTRNSIKLISF